MGIFQLYKPKMNLLGLLYLGSINQLNLSWLHESPSIGDEEYQLNKMVACKL